MKHTLNTESKNIKIDFYYMRHGFGTIAIF